MKRWLVIASVLYVGMLLTAQETDFREQILAAMRKATTFFAEHVAIKGGYHYYYADDLSHGRSEHLSGPTQVEFQREGTPLVAMAYLDAYDATGERHYLDAARKAGNAYVLGQLCSGGWDYGVEFDPAKRGLYAYRADNNCGPDRRGVTNLDDDVTQSAIRFLMRLDRALDFGDAEIHNAVQFALEKLLEAQYPIGAWPQRFSKPPAAGGHPVKRASYPESWSRKWPGPEYQQHYTFNDNTLADMIDVMLEAARIYKEPRYLASAEKAGQFILLAQMPDPQPAWAQQYDANMHPAWARVFEPPSVTGGETQSILKILMVLYRETGERKYLEPIPRALAYLKRSVLPPVENPSEARRRVGEPALARFYELRTNRPLYITKGARLAAGGLGSRLVGGYELSYRDESVITHYGVLVSGAWLGAVEREFEEIKKANPGTLQRPERLKGLSPWQDGEGPSKSTEALAAECRKIASSMDSRGAWVTQGTVGKADRLVSLYAGRPMVLRIARRSSLGSGASRGGSQSEIIQLGENDTIEVFEGELPPRQRIIDSSVFASNLGTLSACVAKPR